MATKKTTAVATRVPKTDMTSIEAQLEAEAGNIKSLIVGGGAPKISLDRTGHFIGPDGLDMGNEIRGVVVDYIFKNQFYTSTYDPNNPAPPVCVAMATLEGLPEMAPDPASPEPQHEDCATCPHNQWGSRGKGKACKNTYELAFILEEDLEAEEPKLYQISVPPTGMSSFSAFANLCARVLNGGPIKAIVTVRAVPRGTYTTMSFSDPDNNPEYGTHFQLREEAHALLMRTPDFSNYKPTKPSKAAGRH